MQVNRSYDMKILNHEFYGLFKESVKIYRETVSFFLNVCLAEWDTLSNFSTTNEKLNFIERLCISTKKRPVVKYDFEKSTKAFYKLPSYLRRASIREAIGKVTSYKSNLINWEQMDVKTRGKKPLPPKVGFVYPALYKKNMFKQMDDNTVAIKVWIRNTWDWIIIKLNKSDVLYAKRYCKNSTVSNPTLQKRGKLWYLTFCYTDVVNLKETPLEYRTVLSVDLGINSACVCSAMLSNGTVIGRHFCDLSIEEDSLRHQLNYIKKVQSTGVKRMPRLFGHLTGINDDIAVKTANFIIGVAKRYDVDVIVFEALNLQGRKKGSRKQRLHHWKAKRVQSIVCNKAHLLGMHVNHVNSCNTSRLAFDGSGKVKRGKEGGFDTYELCRFSTGKIYNCDLNASYNIGSRYFLREYIKTMPERVWSELQTKDSDFQNRTTFTLSTLIKLNAILKDECLLVS